MKSSDISSLQDKIAEVTGSVPGQFLHIDTSTQQLHLINNTTVNRSYSISTSSLGTGNREGSFQTPPGIHRITEKIGTGAPAWRIFESRNDTGINWEPGMGGENCILSRILRLQGLEKGKNLGPGIDSYDRYIYIHGTNREDAIGTPISHGCICMRNHDIIELFDLIPEDALVIID